MPTFAFFFAGALDREARFVLVASASSSESAPNSSSLGGALTLALAADFLGFGFALAMDLRGTSSSLSVSSALTLGGAKLVEAAAAAASLANGT